MMTSKKMCSKYVLIFLCMIVLSPAVKSQGQPVSYKQRVNIIQDNINSYFYDTSRGLYYEAVPLEVNEKAFSYLWPLCALIQGANEAATLQPSKEYLAPVMEAIAKYYNPAPPAPGYGSYITALEKNDRFYDDNQWIAIACLDAWERTADKKYLDIAGDICRFMMTGYDTITGGGIYWKENDLSSKNTCSNGPGILIALRMYSITQEQKYLDTALLLYQWVNKYLQAPTGVYFDNIRIPSLQIDRKTYTYNTGTMLESNVWLYRITREKKYLAEARRIAQAGKEHFYNNNKLPGLYWFNAVFLRGYIELFKVDKDQKWLHFFREEADRIWNDERDENNLLGTDARKKTLIDQAAMLEIYARLSAIESTDE